MVWIEGKGDGGKRLTEYDFNFECKQKFQTAFLLFVFCFFVFFYIIRVEKQLKFCDLALDDCFTQQKWRKSFFSWLFFLRMTSFYYCRFLLWIYIWLSPITGILGICLFSRPLKRILGQDAKPCWRYNIENSLNGTFLWRRCRWFFWRKRNLVLSRRVLPSPATRTVPAATWIQVIFRASSSSEFSSRSALYLDN